MFDGLEHKYDGNDVWYSCRASKCMQNVNDNVKLFGLTVTQKLVEGRRSWLQSAKDDFKAESFQSNLNNQQVDEMILARTKDESCYECMLVMK